MSWPPTLGPSSDKLTDAFSREYNGSRCGCSLVGQAPPNPPGKNAPAVIEKRRATILENQKLTAPGHHVLTFDAGNAMAEAARPGQFIGVAMDTGGVQFLRRPFSFFSADPATG